MAMPSELVQPAVSITALFDNGNAWLDQAMLAELIEPPRWSQAMEASE